jgi:hypothetical protein
MAEQFTFPQNGDRDDAEHFAAMIGRSNMSNFVEEGLNFTVSYGVPEVQVTTGKAFIKIDSGTAVTSGDTILSLGYVVQVPQQTVSLTDGDVNYVYLEPNLGTDDSAAINVYTSQQSEPSLLIGTIDTTADTANRENRNPEGSYNKIDFGDNSEFSIEHNESTGALDLVVSGVATHHFEDDGSVTLAGSLDMDSNAINDTGGLLSFGDMPTADGTRLDRDFHNKQEGGTVTAGNSVPLLTKELSDGETLAVHQAHLSQNGWTTPVASGVDLVIASETGLESTILSGDGSTNYPDSTGSPLASYTNNTGSAQVVGILLDNGEYGSGAGSDVQATGGFSARVY